MARTRRLPRREVRFSGAGGQGIVLAATVFADAATADGREVVVTESHGPEARGGSSRAEVIIAADAIDYPEATTPDLTLCLSQEAFDAYAGETKAGGTVVYDERLVEPCPLPGVTLVGAPLTDLAGSRLGKSIVANMVALGLVANESGLVTLRALEAALRRRVPAHLRDVNLRALRLGRELGTGCPGGRRPDRGRGAAAGAR